MPDVVNLRRFRKAKARRQKAEQADARRAKHARGAADRRAENAEARRQRGDLDGKRIDRNGEGGDESR